MRNVLMLIASMAFVAALVGCQPETPSQVQLQSSVSGTVAYRERIALPENALVTVRLQDISLADAPAKLIAEQVIQTQGRQVPFEFELNYDEDVIQLGHTYALSARIEIEGQLRFITDTIYPVITDSKKTLKRDLILVGVAR